MIFAKFIAFDLETTGLEAAKNEIIEFGAVKFTVENKNGTITPKKIGEFQSLVKPNMLIPEQATHINGITNAMVESAPPVQDVLRKFTAFCGQDTYWVAHNAPFDSEFLRIAYRKNPQFLPTSPIFDSLKIAKTLLSVQTYKLGELAKILRAQGQIGLNLESSELHRALYDCEVLGEVFVALLRKRFKEKDFEMGAFLQAALKIQPDPIYLNKK
ncbi:MAG TPA: 3'-5' exonuclease [Fibrobacteraceae bacterium]|nr:3'-5' exonuclease [Fibrobacteraceae bacterium]